MSILLVTPTIKIVHRQNVRLGQFLFIVFLNKTLAQSFFGIFFRALSNTRT